MLFSFYLEKSHFFLIVSRQKLLFSMYYTFLVRKFKKLSWKKIFFFEKSWFFHKMSCPKNQVLTSKIAFFRYGLFVKVVIQHRFYMFGQKFWKKFFRPQLRLSTIDPFKEGGGGGIAIRENLSKEKFFF